MAQLPLATSTWGPEEYKAIEAVVSSGNFTMGPRVREFEERFAEAFGAKYAVMSNSGSSANLLAVAALFFTSTPLATAGMSAIVPAVSWATTYYPLSQYGLKLKFVDVDPQTLNFDLAKLKAALTDDVGVIFAVNLLGNPNDYAAIEAMIKGRSIVLIEDNCESMGARLDGKFTGTFGKIGTYSSFFSHHISTMEGGMSVTDDEELYHLMLSLRAHGWTRGLPWPNKLVEPDPRGPFYDVFRFILPGYNLRPLEMSGAIGVEQLKKLPALVAARRENAMRFQTLFSDIPNVRIQREIGDSSWFGFAMVLEGAAKGRRDELVQRLAQAGIETRPIVAGNFFNNPVMRYLPHIENPGLVAADDVEANGLYVGNHHYDIAEGLRALRDVVGGLVDG